METFPIGVTETSIDSIILLEPHLYPKEKIMLDKFIDHWPRALANFELQDFLGWPINSITGRRNSLQNKQMIEYRGKRWNPKTLRNVEVWRYKKRL